MASSSTRSVVCPVLIGRSRHLDSINQVVAEVLAGRGQSAAICGEAGIGKSRLVSEAKTRMGERGAAVLEGSCFEPDATLPYAPIVDMLRSCFASRPPEDVIDCVASDAADLVKLIPELAAIVPGLVPAPALDPEQEKRRMFLALAQVFGRMAAKGPLLVIVEDLHWCDDTSLEFLLYAARRISSLPILILLTYRSDEVQPTLGHFLAQLERERLVTEWSLSRLGAGEVDEMIRSIFDLGSPVPADFLEAIHSLTEGNPFFIEEVLKSLVSSGDIFYADGNWDRKPMSELNIPRSVHDAVRVRTEQLSSGAQELLTLAAVAGRRFDFALLQRVSQRDERSVLASIKEMMAAQLVVEDSDDHFSFRHALTQHVIYGDLLARERRALHRTIAENLRQMHSGAIDAHLADLAHHFYEAGSWDEAYYYCRRVGENTQKLFASRAAVEHFSRAIDAAQHLAITPPAKLALDRGLSYELIGEFNHALADYERALAIGQAANDRLAQWQAQIALGSLWAGRDYNRTGEFFRNATDLARSLDDSALVAQSLNRLGNWLANTGVPEEALAAHHDALSIFEASGDQQGRADTLDLLGMANGLYGNIPDSLARFDAAVLIFRELGDDQGLISGLGSRGAYGNPGMQDLTYSVHRSFNDVEHDALEAIDLARRIGWHAGRAYAEFTAAAVYGGFGDFGRSIKHGREALRIGTEIEHQQWAIAGGFTLGHVYIFMRIPDLAVHYLEEALPPAQKLGSAWWIGNVSSYLALSYLMKADTARARAVLAAAMPADDPTGTLPRQRMAWAWGELALAEGEADRAMTVAERLIASVPGDARQPVPALLSLRARALIALGRMEEAEADLLSALGEATERHHPTQMWNLQEELARMYESCGRHAEAAVRQAAARDLVDSLAATIDDAALRDQFLAAALRAAASKRPLSLLQAEKAAYGGLTARERDVAALIAQGRSNRDIAQELVLGERTVETHVGNILSKLQFSSRAQVAVWAVENGLPNKAK